MNESASYTIKRGDSIYNLARAYNTTISAILDANPDLSPYNLKIGSVILIPINYRNNSELEGMRQPLQLQPRQERVQRSPPEQRQQMYTPRQQFYPPQQPEPRFQPDFEEDISEQRIHDEDINFDFEPSDYIDNDNSFTEQQLHNTERDEKLPSKSNAQPPQRTGFDNVPKEPDILSFENGLPQLQPMQQQIKRDESIDFDNRSQELQPSPQQDEKITFDNMPGQQNNNIVFDNNIGLQMQEMLIDVPDITPHTLGEQTLPASKDELPPAITPPKRQFRLFSDRIDSVSPAGSMSALYRDIDRAVTDLSQFSRFFVISMLSDLDDGDETAARLVRTAADIGSKFGMFYPRSVSSRIEELFSDFIMAQIRLLDAYNNSSQDMPALNTAWTESAHKLSESLSGINPNYSYDVIDDYLNKFIDDSKRLFVLRMGGEYADEIGVYDGIASNLADFAKYLADGISKQFPNRFKAAEAM